MAGDKPASEDLSAAMRHVLIAFALAATPALAPPALAQERTPEMRGALTSLTRVLGEAHALRQVCDGREDQYWRSRMNRLMETEQPDAALEGQLKDGFNAGFAEAKRLYPACSDSSRQALALAAVRGRELSGKLARAKYRVNVLPPPVVEDQGVTTDPLPR